jgi:RNA polymerase sigma-70 factor (ECF subfamily)
LLRQRKFLALDETEAGLIEDPTDNPESALVKKSYSTLLQKCLNALSPNHRKIIDLVYYQSKSIQEAAEIVGIPLNTVKTRMFYARNQLGKVLKQAGVEHAYA